jgi:hypothetical protein
MNKYVYCSEHNGEGWAKDNERFNNLGAISFKRALAKEGRIAMILS